jgi:hypothetical protein
MDTGIVRSRRWTRVEYARLMDCGLLREGDPVELVGGHLVIKEPQYTPHATAVRLVVRALEAVFTAGWEVRAGPCPEPPRSNRVSLEILDASRRVTDARRVEFQLTEQPRIRSMS